MYEFELFGSYFLGTVLIFLKYFLIQKNLDINNSNMYIKRIILIKNYIFDIRLSGIKNSC